MHYVSVIICLVFFSNILPRYFEGRAGDNIAQYYVPDYTHLICILLSGQNG